MAQTFCTVGDNLKDEYTGRPRRVRTQLKIQEVTVLVGATKKSQNSTQDPRSYSVGGCQLLPNGRLNNSRSSRN
ncbi:hypothetical protein B7P43_G07350 [Cryptotermes secundus]|uniref:Uncharacterized protein n=1 Tax=Cryptotermes secundus TaxID=105785 RepID=A0A2J7PMS9_9NEOP|nr:hypothetical protein B7P43_G07350 [Cryptotermes secundus]